MTAEAEPTALVASILNPSWGEAILMWVGGVGGLVFLYVGGSVVHLGFRSLVRWAKGEAEDDE